MNHYAATEQFFLLEHLPTEGLLQMRPVSTNSILHGWWDYISFKIDVWLSTVRCLTFSNSCRVPPHTCLLRHLQQVDSASISAGTAHLGIQRTGRDLRTPVGYSNWQNYKVLMYCQKLSDEPVTLKRNQPKHNGTAELAEYCRRAEIFKSPLKCMISFQRFPWYFKYS